MNEQTHEELLETLKIQTVVNRVGAGGTWVGGHIGGHRFSALVFKRPAANAAWEVTPGSRISKLWLKRLEDDTVVYNWDRGEDVAPRSDEAARIVDLLAAGLADLIWGLGGDALPPGGNGRRTAVCNR